MTYATATSAPQVDPQPTDGELVAAAIGGQRSAFEALVRRHQRALYFVCYRHVHDHDAAADLAQRSFIRAMNNLDSLRNTDSFRGWLLTIGTRLSLNHLRDAARTINQDIPEPAVTPETNGPLESAEQSEALQAAVAALPNRQRAVMQLRIYQELSFNDIARALDTNANAAKVNFHMAFKKLQRMLVKAPETESAGTRPRGRPRRPPHALRAAMTSLAAAR